MPKAPTDPKARAIALLSRREHSARELTRKLKAKGLSGEDAASAVEYVTAEGWQSDARYAGMMVRSRINQGYGPRRIEAELRQAGVPGDDISRAMDEAGADWNDLARAAHARKFGAVAASSAERAKQYRFLQGRGFDGSQIGAALKGEFDD